MDMLDYFLSLWAIDGYDASCELFSIVFLIFGLDGNANIGKFDLLIELGPVPLGLYLG
jgi:hypothetical protein